MRYDEYLRLGYGIGSGAVESAHKQVVQATTRVKQLAVSRVPKTVTKAQRRKGKKGPTGALRKSFKKWSKARQLRGGVVSVVDYSAQVELGTSKMAARPMLRPAADQVRPGFLRAVHKVLPKVVALTRKKAGVPPKWARKG